MAVVHTFLVPRPEAEAAGPVRRSRPEIPLGAPWQEVALVSGKAKVTCHQLAHPVSNGIPEQEGKPTDMEDALERLPGMERALHAALGAGPERHLVPLNLGEAEATPPHVVTAQHT